MPNRKSKIENRKSFLITAGPTIEDIDPVRFLSNRSTGKMGVFLALAALRRGHRVILVHGPLSDSVQRMIPVARTLHVVPVRSAAQMHTAVMKHVRAADVVIMNAAVADYTPVSVARFKLKKSTGDFILRLRPTIDILRELGRLKVQRPTLRLIGFALESGRGRTTAQRRAARLAEARRKLESKNLDAIVLDTPHAMGADASDFTILDRDGTHAEFKRISKREFARELIERAVQQ